MNGLLVEEKKAKRVDLRSKVENESALEKLDEGHVMIITIFEEEEIGGVKPEVLPPLRQNACPHDTFHVQ